VQVGDSIWSIAADRLGPNASVASVNAAWHQIYAANATVIGSNPNLLRPGQVLKLAT